jgi:hypothetical protein
MNLLDELAAAKARGAVVVDDSIPGQGFSEDDTYDPLYDNPAVKDMEKRYEDASGNPPAEIDELTKQFRESNTNAVRKFRFTHQDDYMGWVPGRILWLGDFLAMLQTIRPDAFYAEYSYMGLRGLGFIENGKPQYSGTSVANGNFPEWSQLRVDARGLPTTERYRGWRTVLLALINKGFITLEQSDKVFGKPTGPRSRPWYRTLFSIRNGRCAECGQGICECADGYDYLRADNYAYEIPLDVAAGRRQVIDKPEESRIWTP